MSIEPNVLTFHQLGPGARGNRWRLRAPNGEILAASTEPCRERRGAYENAAQVLGAGILAGHHVIPSVIDRPAVMAAIEQRYGSGRVLRVWNEGNLNDGVYEYVETGDCHGGNLAWHRHRPAVSIPSTPWETATREAYEQARYPQDSHAEGGVL